MSRAGVAVAMLAAAPSAWAASNAETPVLDAQAFRPSPDATTALWTDDTHIGAPGFVFRSLCSYTNDPLVYTYEDGRTVGLVSDLLQVDVMPAVRFSNARIGLDVPLYPAVYARDQRVIIGEGDWRLDGKLVALDGGVAPIGVGVGASLGLPLGTTDGLRAGTFSGEARLLLDKASGSTRVAANLGVRFQPARDLEGLDWGDAAVVKLSASEALSLLAGVTVEAVGSAPLADPFAPGALAAEWMASGWFRHRSLVVHFGAGTGLTRGVGSPDVRAVAGFGWERRDGPGDRDGDGVPNRVDRCPADPEDRDGYADQDGCADPDNDDDGVRDGTDLCPTEPEDHDHQQDGDGCAEF